MSSERHRPPWEARPLSTPAIRVSGLGKRYRIGERVRYKSLRESLSNAVTRTFRGGRRTEETIWALKDVSFEVAPGEVVGVIGRNGAGKIHAAQDPVPHHRADRGARRAARARRKPARGRHRLPPGADRPREHLSQRRHPGHEARRDRPQVRRDRRVRRDRAASSTPP